MTLGFDISEGGIVASAKIVKEFIPFLEEMKMYYYFPFTQNATTEIIKAQIKIDSDTFKFTEAVNSLHQSWEKFAPDIITKLNTLSKDSVTNTYICIPTFYGPYGYYYTPDTVYVNVTKGIPDEWIETLVHELLHLILEQEIKKLSHLEEERFIDKTFVELFGDIFPNYQVQNI